MRFFHLSDLHIGKQLHFYNLKENQQAMLHQIADRVREYRPDVILICGDIFDKSIPSGEAYVIFDEFLNELAEITPRIPVLIIGGNHDSPQRLSYAKSFLENNQFYVSALPPEKEGETLKKVTLSDQWGQVHFYLLPFLKPGYVRHLFPEGKITDYSSAIEAVLAQEQLDLSQRNVLLSHQFYVNGDKQPQCCDSEQGSFQVGGVDSVKVSLVEPFDYVALGHIHGAQQVKHPHIRYCGTPLKYSVSEEHHKKSITMVTLDAKGTPPVIEEIPLVPIQEVRREKGTLEEVLSRATPENKHDFISVTLTDDLEIFHPMEQLGEQYDHILEVRMDNRKTRALLEAEELPRMQMDPYQVFSGFYQEMQGQPMGTEEQEWLKKLLEQMQKEDI